MTDFPYQDTMQKGSIVKLLDNTNVDLPLGVLGTLTADLVHVDKAYAAFMPESEFGVFIMDASNLVLMTEDELKVMGIENVYPELPEELAQDGDTMEDYLPLLDK